MIYWLGSDERLRLVMTEPCNIATYQDAFGTSEAWIVAEKCQPRVGYRALCAASVSAWARLQKTPIDKLGLVDPIAMDYYH